MLKGWVESRCGLVPCFHGERLEHFPSPAWIKYLEEKASSRFHNNCIYQQLDLLYEFCQWALQRFQPFGAVRQVPLWRGITRCEEQIVRGHAGPGQAHHRGAGRLLAGALCGAQALPRRWLGRLERSTRMAITEQTSALLALPLGAVGHVA